MKVQSSYIFTKKIIVIIFTVFIIFTITGSYQYNEINSLLDDYTKELEKENIDKYSIMYFHNNQLVFTKSNFAKSDSISIKYFGIFPLYIQLLDLLESKSISVNADIRKYIPELRSVLSNSVSIKQLLTHRTPFLFSRIQPSYIEQTEKIKNYNPISEIKSSNLKQTDIKNQTYKENYLNYALISYLIKGITDTSSNNYIQNNLKMSNSQISSNISITLKTNMNDLKNLFQNSASKINKLFGNSLEKITFKDYDKFFHYLGFIKIANTLNNSYMFSNPGGDINIIFIPKTNSYLISYINNSEKTGNPNKYLNSFLEKHNLDFHNDKGELPSNNDDIIDVDSNVLKQYEGVYSIFGTPLEIEAKTNKLKMKYTKFSATLKPVSKNKFKISYLFFKNLGTVIFSNHNNKMHFNLNMGGFQIPTGIKLEKNSDISKFSFLEGKYKANYSAYGVNQNLGDYEIKITELNYLSLKGTEENDKGFNLLLKPVSNSKFLIVDGDITRNEYVYYKNNKFTFGGISLHK